jgi:hypothetical protein
MRRFAVNVFAGGVLLFSAVPALAADATAPTPQAAARGSDPNQVVCVQMRPETGSRIGAGMQCHTVKEWANIQGGADQYNMVQRDLGGSLSGGTTPQGSMGGRPR